MTGRRPVLSAARVAPTFAVTAKNEHGADVDTAIPVERPLTVYVNKRELVTLMTLGSAPEQLVLGYLRNQRLVSRLDQVEEIQVDWETGAAIALIEPEAAQEIEARTVRRVVTTGCGQGTVFGSIMDDLDELALNPDLRVSQAAVYAIVEAIRSQPSVYREAGSVHGCALFAPTADGADLLAFCEDVGRHNAVDAIAGRMWLEGWTGRDKVFYTTGRLTSEMVIKGAQMGIPVLMSRSGVTQMGYDVARQVGMTLLGRCLGRHFLVFTGAERLIQDPGLAAAPRVARPGRA